MNHQQQRQCLRVNGGYNVLHVQRNSPAEQAGIESFTDFIVTVDGVHLQQDENSVLSRILHESNKKSIRMVLHSIKTKLKREIQIVPQSDWGDTEWLIGVDLRFCTFKYALEHVWHILDMYPYSPAAQSGLRANSDYIYGTALQQYKNSDLYTMLRACEQQCIPLYVYNTEEELARVVYVTPDYRWGGVGSLGCNIAYGLLHRILERPSYGEQTFWHGLETSAPKKSVQRFKVAGIISAMDLDNAEEVSNIVEEYPTTRLSEQYIKAQPPATYRTYRAKLVYDELSTDLDSNIENNSNERIDYDADKALPPLDASDAPQIAEVNHFLNLKDFLNDTKLTKRNVAKSNQMRLQKKFDSLTPTHSGKLKPAAFKSISKGNQDTFTVIN